LTSLSPIPPPPEPKRVKREPKRSVDAEGGPEPLPGVISMSRMKDGPGDVQFITLGHDDYMKQIRDQRKASGNLGFWGQPRSDGILGQIPSSLYITNINKGIQDDIIWAYAYRA